MLLVHRTNNFIDGHGIQKADKVKTETVEMILISPVADGINDVLTHHRTLGCRVISAAGTVGVFSVFGSGEIIGYDLIEAEVLRVINVVVDNIHNNTDAVIVQSLNHLLHFTDTHCTIVRVSGV